MSNNTINIENDSKLSQLKALLYLLQTNLEEFKDDVDASYELLKIGEKTELSRKLEKKIDNPIGDIFQFSNKILLTGFTHYGILATHSTERTHVQVCL